MSQPALFSSHAACYCAGRGRRYRARRELGVVVATYALSLENQNDFCASCHTQPQVDYYIRTLHQPPIDLAGAGLFYRGRDGEVGAVVADFLAGLML